MKVVFLEEAVDCLNELVKVLYEDGYFGFKESAFQYVDDIYDFVEYDIAKSPKKKAPVYFDKYGKDMSYIAYKRNENTTWYVFFNYADDVYSIRFIGNNHNVGQYL